MAQSDPTNQHSKAVAQIEEALLAEDPNLFEGLQPDKKNQILQRFSRVAFEIKHHSGPLPPPELMRDYNAIIPNGAERIMNVFEKQSDHRMKLERWTIGWQLAQSQLGQFFAFLLGLSAIGGSIYCILQGHEWGGAFLAGGGLTSLVVAFLKGKEQQKESLESKDPRNK